MKVVAIGAGSVATHLIGALHKSGCQIMQVYSRTIQSATALAEQVGAMAINHIYSVYSDADYYIFSVKDDALSEIITQMPKTKGTWLHTAGSVSMNIFDGFHHSFGVLYPFQTFSRQRKVEFSTIPLFIEANNDDALQSVNRLAMYLSDKIQLLSSDKRRYLHLCGVLSCNFVNHLYSLSERILQEQGIAFEALLPLITETVNKVKHLSPSEAQTGPALRNDERTMQAHLLLLQDDNLKQIYKLLSQSIYQTSKQ